MTDQFFYHAAAKEVDAVIVDPALWTKVTVDMHGAGVQEQQARYVQLRALELSVASKVAWIRPFQRTLIGVVGLFLTFWVIGPIFF